MQHGRSLYGASCCLAAGSMYSNPVHALLSQRELGSRSNDRINSIAFHSDFAKRLQQSSSLANRSNPSAGGLCFADGGKLLVGGEDCTVRVWDPDSKTLIHEFDPGHTEQISCIETLPGTGGRIIITAGPSKDIRLIDLCKEAVRPYSGHGCSILSILPLSTSMFASGGTDGTIRCHDSRAPSTSHTSAQSNQSLLVRQKTEAAHRMGNRVGVHSMAHDPINQQYIATGGGDALVRVYDVRMIRAPTQAHQGFSSNSPPPWCFCLAPSQLRASTASMLSQRHNIASVEFDSSGQRLLASYAHDGIYAFDVCSHSMSFDQLVAAQREPTTRAPHNYSPHGYFSDAAFGSLRSQRHEAAPEHPPSGARVSRAAGVHTRRQAGAAEAVLLAGSGSSFADALRGALPSTAADSDNSAPRNAAGRRRVSARRSSSQHQQQRQHPLQRAAAANHAVASAAAMPAPLDGHQPQLPLTTAADEADGLQVGPTEVVISAEVHLVGPGGTVLHTARLPLHRAVASPGAFLSRLGGTAGAATAAAAADSIPSLFQGPSAQQGSAAAGRSMFGAGAAEGSTQQTATRQTSRRNANMRAGVQGRTGRMERQAADITQEGLDGDGRVGTLLMGRGPLTRSSAAEHAGGLDTDRDAAWLTQRGEGRGTLNVSAAAPAPAQASAAAEPANSGAGADRPPLRRRTSSRSGLHAATAVATAAGTTASQAEGSRRGQQPQRGSGSSTLASSLRNMVSSLFTLPRTLSGGSDTPRAVEPGRGAPSAAAAASNPDQSHTSNHSEDDCPPRKRRRRNPAAAAVGVAPSILPALASASSGSSMLPALASASNDSSEPDQSTGVSSDDEGGGGDSARAHKQHRQHRRLQHCFVPSPTADERGSPEQQHPWKDMQPRRVTARRQQQQQQAVTTSQQHPRVDAAAATVAANVMDTEAAPAAAVSSDVNGSDSDPQVAVLTRTRSGRPADRTGGDPTAGTSQPGQDAAQQPTNTSGDSFTEMARRAIQLRMAARSVEQQQRQQEQEQANMQQQPAAAAGLHVPRNLGSLAFGVPDLQDTSMTAQTVQHMAVDNPAGMQHQSPAAVQAAAPAASAAASSARRRHAQAPGTTEPPRVVSPALFMQGFFTRAAPANAARARNHEQDAREDTAEGSQEGQREGSSGGGLTVGQRENQREVLSEFMQRLVTEGFPVLRQPAQAGQAMRATAADGNTAGEGSPTQQQQQWPRRSAARQARRGRVFEWRAAGGSSSSRQQCPAVPPAAAAADHQPSRWLGRLGAACRQGLREVETEPQGAAARLRAELQLPLINRAEAEQRRHDRCKQGQGCAGHQQGCKHAPAAQPTPSSENPPAASVAPCEVAGLQQGAADQKPGLGAGSCQPPQGRPQQQSGQHSGRKRKWQNTDNVAGAQDGGHPTDTAAAGQGPDEQYIAGMAGAERVAARAAAPAAAAAAAAAASKEQLHTNTRSQVYPAAAGMTTRSATAKGQQARAADNRQYDTKQDRSTRSRRRVAVTATSNRQQVPHSGPRTRSARLRQQQIQLAGAGADAAVVEQQQLGSRHSRAVSAQQRRRQVKPAAQPRRTQKGASAACSGSSSDHSSSSDSDPDCSRAAQSRGWAAGSHHHCNALRRTTSQQRRTKRPESAKPAGETQHDSTAVEGVVAHLHNTAEAAAAAGATCQPAQAAAPVGDDKHSAASALPPLTRHPVNRRQPAHMPAGQLRAAGAEGTGRVGGVDLVDREDSREHVQGLDTFSHAGRVEAAALHDDAHISQGYAVKYSGHANSFPARNAVWMGNRSQYVVSGSDDGCLFVWDARTAEIINVVKGGAKSIRKVQVHPRHMLIASTASEPVVRLWSPEATSATSREEVAELAAASRAAADAGQAGAQLHPAGLPGLMGMLQHIGEQLMGGLLNARERDRGDMEESEDRASDGSDVV